MVSNLRHARLTTPQQRKEGDLMVGRYGRSHLVTGRTAQPLPARPAPDRRDYDHRRDGHDRRVPPTAADNAPILDLGPRRRNDETRRLHRRHRHPDLLLTPTAPGNAAATRTATGCSDSTFRRRPTCQSTTLMTSKPWSTSSTTGLDKGCDGKLLTRSSGPQTLRSSLEATADN